MMGLMRILNHLILGNLAFLDLELAALKFNLNIDWIMCSTILPTMIKLVCISFRKKSTMFLKNPWERIASFVELIIAEIHEVGSEWNLKVTRTCTRQILDSWCTRYALPLWKHNWHKQREKPFLLSTFSVTRTFLC